MARAIVPAAQDGRRVLEVWTPESGTRLKLVQQRAEQFSAAHPDVKVNFTIRDFGSYPPQLKLALASDRPPDVVIGNLGWALDGPLIKAGLLRALDPWAARYGWDKRFPEVAQRQMRFTTDGKRFGSGPIFGVPYAADVIGWFYNVGKLKKLNIGSPGHASGARGSPRDGSRGRRGADHAGKQAAMARAAPLLSGEQRSRLRP